MQGHKISNESIKLSHKHAHQVKEQGKRLERVGASLSRDERFTPQEIEFVQRTAQQIQDCAKAMLMYTEIAELNEEHSTNAFTVAGNQHAEAIRLHVEVNRVLAKLGSTSSEV